MPPVPRGPLRSSVESPAAAPSRAKHGAQPATFSTLIRPVAGAVGLLLLFGGMLILRLSSTAGSMSTRAWSSVAPRSRPPPHAAPSVGASPSAVNARADTIYATTELVPTTWRVLRRISRDGACFTQGLAFRGRTLFEGCGLHGESRVQRVSLQTGEYVVQHASRNPNTDFGEGIVTWPPAADDSPDGTVAPGKGSPKLLQLTWQERAVVVWDTLDGALAVRTRVPFSSTNNEGWGITSDGFSELIMSDGSAKLHFWSPESAVYTSAGAMVSVRSPVAVYDRVRHAAGYSPSSLGPPWAPSTLVRPSKGGFGRDLLVQDLNELEYAHGWILANIWYDPRVAIIHPRTGVVVWFLDFSSLLAENPAPADCLNGLAYTMFLDVVGGSDSPVKASTPWGGRLWVTGKQWRNIYEVELGGLVNASELANLGDSAGTGVRARRASAGGNK